MLGDGHGREHTCFACRPRDALTHVAGARRDDAAGEGRGVGRADRVRGAPDLEGADGLQALELEIDLAGGVDDQADDRDAHGRARDAGARLLDRLERDQKATVVPAPVSRARRARYSAAYRSSTAIPSDSKTVISS